ncbi:MAG: phosphate regulon sensor histidine kinase PhoR [Immundisolibacterales bacterium]|nr:phosphate regulon sensor histidine kinase PhoR [Immundisolibacterales bacterium]
MRRAWLAELWIIGGLFAAGVLIGYFAGAMPWWVAGAGVLYAAFNLRNARRYLGWVRGGLNDPPPDASGLWAEVMHQVLQERRNARDAAREADALVEQYERSVQALPDGIVILDADLYIRWSNAAAQRLIGLQDPEDRGQHIDNLLRHPEFTDYRQRGDLDRFIQIPAPTIVDRVIRVGLVPFSSGQYLLVCRDVTERVRIDRVRRDFLSNVSHELRTPITVLGGYLEMLQDATDELPDRWKRPVDAMHGQALRMRHLVDDLLLLSRMESLEQPDTREEIDIDRLAAQVREEAVALSGAREHRIELEVEAGTRVSGSVSEFRAMFSNLVRNAVQYTAEGGLIRIEWRLDEDAARFVVTDEGEGIEPEHLSRLTERFYRVDKGRSRDAGGTGLGLAIVKHALLHYDGELEIESEPGHGSRFACRFPRAIVIDSPPAPSPLAPSAPCVEGSGAVC